MFRHCLPEGAVIEKNTSVLPHHLTAILFKKSCGFYFL